VAHDGLDSVGLDTKIATYSLLTCFSRTQLLSTLTFHSVQGTAFQDRFYEMRVTCGENYPAVPPTVRFVSRLNLPCVNSVRNQNTQAKTCWTFPLGPSPLSRNIIQRCHTSKIECSVSVFSVALRRQKDRFVEYTLAQ
jgi:hypothetical protein